MDLFRGGKWYKYLLLKRNEHLAPFLPQTELFSEKKLWFFLDEHRNAILKPKSGCGGKGIFKVSLKAGNQYEIHYKRVKNTYTTPSEVNAFIKKYKKTRTYLMQRWIPLASFQNRPFDLRVIVQRKKGGGPWVVTGKYAKVAHAGYIITNLARNGTVVPVRTALGNSHIAEPSLDLILEQIDQVSLLAANQLSQVYRNHHLWGLDIGVDQEGKVWVIEANPTPRYDGFLDLPDKSMYNQIRAFLEFNQVIKMADNG